MDGTVFSENSQRNVVMWHYIVTCVLSVRGSSYSVISRYCIQRISMKHYTNHNSKLSCRPAFVSNKPPISSELHNKPLICTNCLLQRTLFEWSNKPPRLHGRWIDPIASPGLRGAQCSTCWEKHRTTRSMWIYWTWWFIVDLPIKNGDFQYIYIYSYISLPAGKPFV